MASYEELKMNIESYIDSTILWSVEISTDEYIREDVVATRQSTKNFSNLIFDVRTGNEGNKIPHFHVYVPEGKYTNNGEDTKTFHTCIRLNVPEYFNHGSKQGKFNNNDLKYLIKILKKPMKKHDGKTLWRVMVDIWNASFDGDIDVDNMPDYDLLRRFH